MRACAGSGGRFWRITEGGRVPKSSGVLVEVAGAKVPEGLGRFWKVPCCGELTARRRF